MVIDSSAIIAILCDEPEAERFTEAIENDPTRLISAASLVGLLVFHSEVSQK